MRDVIKYKDYIGTLHYSSDDKVFFGQIFGINDLVNFEAGSVDQLIRTFHEAVDDYISTCKEIGKKPEKSFNGSFNVRVPQNLHRDASFIATTKSITLNEFVRNAISFAVNNPDEVLDKDLFAK